MLENNYVPNLEIPWKVQKLVDTKEQSVLKTDKRSDA